MKFELHKTPPSLAAIEYARACRHRVYGGSTTLLATLISALGLLFLFQVGMIFGTDSGFNIPLVSGFTVLTVLAMVAVCWAKSRLVALEFVGPIEYQRLADNETVSKLPEVLSYCRQVGEQGRDLLKGELDAIFKANLLSSIESKSSDIAEAARRRVLGLYSQPAVGAASGTAPNSMAEQRTVKSEEGLRPISGLTVPGALMLRKIAAGFPYNHGRTQDTNGAVNHTKHGLQSQNLLDGDVNITPKGRQVLAKFESKQKPKFRTAPVLVVRHTSCTKPMRHMLDNAAAGKHLTAGLISTSQQGGAVATHQALSRRGWLTAEGQITEAGRQVLNRLPDDSTAKASMPNSVQPWSFCSIHMLNMLKNVVAGVPLTAGLSTKSQLVNSVGTRLALIRRGLLTESNIITPEGLTMLNLGQPANILTSREAGSIAGPGNLVSALSQVVTPKNTPLPSPALDSSSADRDYYIDFCSKPMRRMLEAIVDGTPISTVRHPNAIGSSFVTQQALLRRGLIAADGKITAAGHVVLAGAEPSAKKRVEPPPIQLTNSHRSSFCSEHMLNMLENAVAGRSLTAGLISKSQKGNAVGTQHALTRRKLLTEAGGITATGLELLRSARPNAGQTLEEPAPAKPAAGQLVELPKEAPNEVAQVADPLIKRSLSTRTEAAPEVGAELLLSAPPVKVLSLSPAGAAMLRNVAAGLAPTQGLTRRGTRGAATTTKRALQARNLMDAQDCITPAGRKILTKFESKRNPTDHYTCRTKNTR